MANPANELNERPHPAPSRRGRRQVCLALLAVFALSGIVWLAVRKPPETLFEEAWRAGLAGDSRAVLAASRHLASRPGFEAHAHLLDALLLSQGGEDAAALEHVQKAFESQELGARARTIAAGCFYRLGDFARCINVAQDALERDSGLTDARRWLAAAHYDLGASDEAARQLELVARQAPADARPYRLLGLIEKDRERYAAAVAHYRQSLEIDPLQVDRPDIDEELATSLVKLSRFDEALEVLSEASETAQTLTLAAECRHALGDRAQALELLEQAIAHDPEFLPAWTLKGTILLAAGEASRAAKALAEATRAHPYDSAAWFKLSQAWTLLGDESKAAHALAEMQKAQAVEREFFDLHEAVGKDLKDPEIRYRLGQLAQRLRKDDLAVMWFRAALSLAPDHAGARAALVARNKRAP